MANHWAEGSQGAKDLAQAVVEACESSKKEDFKFLYFPPQASHSTVTRHHTASCLHRYDVNASIKDKIFTIAKEMYGAKSVSYSEGADAAIARYTANGMA
jgi:formyltetrahydrofolate synthetase